MSTVQHRLLSILAGLIIFLGSAPSYAITYNVSVSVEGNTVGGTITTNGHLGLLSATDITEYNLVVNAGHGGGLMIGTNPIFSGSPLIAGSTILAFASLSGGSAEFFGAGNIWSLNGSVGPFGAMDFLESTGSGIVEHFVMLPSFFDGHIGGADFTPPVTTPLPTALPMFATGLGALGLLGWSRKKKAATASE